MIYLWKICEMLAEYFWLRLEIDVIMQTGDMKHIFTFVILWSTYISIIAGILNWFENASYIKLFQTRKSIIIW